MALAGVVQAALIVDAVAHGRSVEPEAERAVLHAVLVQEPDSLADVIPEPGRLHDGLAALQRILTKPDVSMAQPARHIVSLLEAARLLRNDPAMVSRLADAIRSASRADESLLETLGTIYVQTLSHLPKRIQVTGDPERLNQAGVASEIRAVLLAGVRYAWLWHQLGGRRWHLLTRRRALQTCAAGLAAALE